MLAASASMPASSAPAASEAIAAMDEEAETARRDLGWTYDRADTEDEPEHGRVTPAGVEGWEIPRQVKGGNQRRAA